MRLDRTSFGKRLGSYAESISLPAQPVVEGRLLRMVGLTLEAEGLRAAMGSRCVVINDDSHHPVEVEAEVMGFSGSKVFLMPVGSVAGIAPGARVVPLADTGRLPMGMSMLGRVLTARAGLWTAARRSRLKTGCRWMARPLIRSSVTPSASRWMSAFAASTVY